MNAKVLILNQNYEPMSVVNVKKAIALLYLGKAELIEAQNGQTGTGRHCFYGLSQHRTTVCVREGSVQKDHPFPQEHPSP